MPRKLAATREPSTTPGCSLKAGLERPDVTTLSGRRSWTTTSKPDDGTAPSFSSQHSSNHPVTLSVWLTFLEDEDKPLFGGTIFADERFAVFEDFEVLDEHLRHLGAVTGCSKVALFIRKQPELLLVPLSVVAERVLALKTLLPDANLPAILLRRPDLLLCEDIPGTLGRAVRQMAAFMPTSYQRRLHSQDNLWRSFESVLPSPRQTRQDVHWIL